MRMYKDEIFENVITENFEAVNENASRNSSKSELDQAIELIT